MKLRTKRRLFLTAISPLIPLLFVADVTRRVWPRVWPNFKALCLATAVCIKCESAVVWGEIRSSWGDDE